MEFFLSEILEKKLKTDIEFHKIGRLHQKLLLRFGSIREIGINTGVHVLAHWIRVS